MRHESQKFVIVYYSMGDGEHRISLDTGPEVHYQHESEGESQLNAPNNGTEIIY